MTTENAQVFYFGDSLTDVGVIFDALVEALTGQIFLGLLAELGPNPPQEAIEAAQQEAASLAQQQATLEAQSRGLGPQYAVTNEFTHATYFEDVSGAHVTNFANAGARALGTQEPFGAGTGYDSNLNAQLDRFAASTDGSLEADAKAVLFIGSNDFSDLVGAVAADPDASIFEILSAANAAIGSLLDALEASARRLDDAGIGTVYFGTLPPATFFPGSDVLDDTAAGFSDLALSIYNALLADTAASLTSDGVDVRVIDYAAVASAFTEDPSGFGVIAERSDFLIDGSTAGSDQVGFWDPIHPAEAVHQAWGAYSAFVMEGGSTAALSDFGTLNVQTNGNNAVFAKGGDDTVFALSGDDIVFGGSGEDTVFGGRGEDIVSGGSGDDLLRGNRNADILDGDGGNDRIFGGSGDDVLIDGLGSDDVRGGRGDDVFIHVEGGLEGDPSATEDSFKGGSGNDTLYLILSGATYESYEQDGVESTLSALGITTASIEAVVAIDGRDQVETVLGGESWFQDADYWGFVPAPSPELIF